MSFHCQRTAGFNSAAADINDAVVPVDHHGNSKCAGDLYRTGSSCILFRRGLCCIRILFKDTADFHVCHTLRHGNKVAALPVCFDNVFYNLAVFFIAQIQLIVLQAIAGAGVHNNLHLLARIGGSDRLPDRIALFIADGIALLVHLHDHGVR